ncbi:MAG: hypothetical protein NPIRA02_39880 [Nitrospirales bacterium]|nr:MAG: hypothetical protein NPIRA02_39880 [Nitrospirales bacterium]
MGEDFHENQTEAVMNKALWLTNVCEGFMQRIRLTSYATHRDREPYHLQFTSQRNI